MQNHIKDTVAMTYYQLSPEQLCAEYTRVKAEYDALCARGLHLDLSRGKPSAEQLDLSEGMLSHPISGKECITEDGIDCRNYGLFEGLPGMRRLFSDLTGVPEKQILVAGNSSLALMYDTISRAMIFGLARSPRPWCREEKRKFICPAPGYDRHFAITELFGFELITVDMTPTGPDMDAVEAIVRDDPTVKGIWCVPMYSNPTGVTYSDETVRRLAEMETAAPDFVIMWDNAYSIHDLKFHGDKLLDIFPVAEAAGHEDRIFYYTSFSKVTFAGGAIAMMAMSENNINIMRPIQGVRTIGYDKINQLRHLMFLKDAEHTRDHMRRHAAIILRKLTILYDALDTELADAGVAEWTHPRGGYFVSMNTPDGCAKRVWELCHNAGVTLTPAGATFPYGIDPRDRNLRIAPTYPSDAELAEAAHVLACVVRLASLEKLLHKI